MKDVTANPLDYVEGGRWNARREELSQWLDGTNPDLSAFMRRGGKMMVAIGTNWVERGVAPKITETVTGGEKSLPLCSYPSYPKHNSGPVTAASSYSCAIP